MHLFLVAHSISRKSSSGFSSVSFVVACVVLIVVVGGDEVFKAVPGTGVLSCPSMFGFFQLLAVEKMDIQEMVGPNAFGMSWNRYFHLSYFLYIVE